MRAGSFGALTRALAVALSVPALMALAACARSPSEKAAEAPSAKAADPTTSLPTTAAAEPAYQPGTAATTVDQALADIQRAEGELSAAFEALSVSQGRKSPAGMPPPAATAGGTAPKSESPQTAPRAASDNELGAGDPCFSACRALASMTRATAHLCGLTGDTDPRCDSARSRLQGARERVEGSCACGPPG
jgi:hypothetical protein